MRPSPVAFSHPGLRRFRPSREPAAQVVAATEARDQMLADPSIDSVTTMVPKRGGAACMVGWQLTAEGRVAVDQLMVTVEGEVVR